MTDDTISLQDIDGDLDDLTTEQARRVEAGDRTDLLCAKVMGFRWEQITYHQHKMSGRETMIEKGWRISRLSQGAHRAREWLREQYKHRSVIVAGKKHSEEGRGYEAAIRSVGGEETFVLAPTEHLATARLILVLAAIGELEEV